jgi:hypothetical protein
MVRSVVTPCDLAVERWRWIKKWRELWSILIFAFGTAIILFLIAAILLLVRQTWLPGALTAAGTIVSSSMVLWVVKRRTEAVAEEKEAWKDYVDTCGQEKVAAEIIKGIVPAPSRGVVGDQIAPTIQAAINERKG